LRLDDAGAVLLIDPEGLSGNSLALDEDSECTGVHSLRWRGVGFVFVFFVGGLGNGAGEKGSE
jgi:hypothetical protein